MVERETSIPSGVESSSSQEQQEAKQEVEQDEQVYVQHVDTLTPEVLASLSDGVVVPPHPPPHPPQNTQTAAISDYLEDIATFDDDDGLETERDDDDDDEDEDDDEIGCNNDVRISDLI